MHNGGASMTIRRCVRTLPHFRFFRKRSRSPSLNPAPTRSCEPSHPQAIRIEATAVLSALRQERPVGDPYGGLIAWIFPPNFFAPPRLPRTISDGSSDFESNNYLAVGPYLEKGELHE